jgi:hypothetical protein
VEAHLNEATSTIRTLTHENELLRINNQPNSNSNESPGNVNSNSNMTDSNVNNSNVGNHGQASHSPANNPVTVIINNNGEKESPLYREILERLSALENQHTKYVLRENPNISQNEHADRSHSATHSYDDSTHADRSHSATHSYNDSTPIVCGMVIGDKPGYTTQTMPTSPAGTPLAVPQQVGITKPVPPTFAHPHAF